MEFMKTPYAPRNLMDFNGLILDACRLAHQVPAVSAKIKQSYPYWMIDESCWKRCVRQA